MFGKIVVNSEWRLYADWTNYNKNKFIMTRTPSPRVLQLLIQTCVLKLFLCIPHQIQRDLGWYTSSKIMRSWLQRWKICLYWQNNSQLFKSWGDRFSNLIFWFVRKNDTVMRTEVTEVKITYKTMDLETLINQLETKEEKTWCTTWSLLILNLT